MNGFERDLANAKGWLRIIAAVGFIFLIGCIMAVVKRSPADDWFTVIWLAAMTGSCVFAELVLAVQYYRVRRDRSRPTATRPT